MNENNDNNNNQNNNYNIYHSMNDDAFSVFNNTQNNTQTQQPVQTAPPQPSQPVQHVQSTPTPPELDPNLVTVNDYKEPKKPFSLKDLLKKQVAEEEKTFNIDDITNFKEVKEQIDPEELKEKRKKTKDLVILIIAVIALIIAGIIAYNTFSNYLLPNQNITEANTVNKKVKSNKVVNNDVVLKYSCDYAFDDTFYNLPAKEYINWESYKGISTYSFLNDKLNIIEEQIDITYNLMDVEINNSVIKYCNSYNKVLDQYQFICLFKDNHLILTNTFYLNKVDKVIGNSLGEYKLRYNKNTILGDVMTTNTSCKVIK